MYNVLRVSGAPNRACRYRTQEQLEPPVKTSADQPRVGRPRSGRKPNSTIPNNRTGRDRYTRWLYIFYLNTIPLTSLGKSSSSYFKIFRNFPTTLKFSSAIGSIRPNVEFILIFSFNLSNKINP